MSGKDVSDAIKASVGKLKAKADVKLDGEKPLWLAVYFGTNGSSPPAYVIQAVEKKGATFRVHYKKGAAFTDDIHAYLAWIPLRTAAKGEYTVELFETGTKTVTMKQVVVVKE